MNILRWCMRDSAAAPTTAPRPQPTQHRFIVSSPQRFSVSILHEPPEKSHVLIQFMKANIAGIQTTTKGSFGSPTDRLQIAWKQQESSEDSPSSTSSYSYELKGTYCTQIPAPMVMCRTPSAEKVVDVLKTYIHFSYILEATLAQSVATAVKLSPEVKIYNYETGTIVHQFQGGEAFAFSVYLPTTVQKAMYFTMLNLSCDTMEIQALDLSGDTPTEPGSFLTPFLNGVPLMSKKLASMEVIHAFEGGNMNAEKNCTIANGKAKVVFAFLATPVRCSAEWIDSLDVSGIEQDLRCVGQVKKVVTRMPEVFEPDTIVAYKEITIVASVGSASSQDATTSTLV